MYVIQNSSGKHGRRIEYGEKRIGTQARYLLNIKSQSESFNYLCRKNNFKIISQYLEKTWFKSKHKIYRNSESIRSFIIK